MRSVYKNPYQYLMPEILSYEKLTFLLTQTPGVPPIKFVLVRIYIPLHCT